MNDVENGWMLVESDDELDGGNDSVPEFEVDERDRLEDEGEVEVKSESLSTLASRSKATSSLLVWSKGSSRSGASRVGITTPRYLAWT